MDFLILEGFNQMYIDPEIVPWIVYIFNSALWTGISCVSTGYLLPLHCTELLGQGEIYTLLGDIGRKNKKKINTGEGFRKINRIIVEGAALLSPVINKVLTLDNSKPPLPLAPGQVTKWPSTNGPWSWKKQAPWTLWGPTILGVSAKFSAIFGSSNVKIRREKKHG